MAGSSKPLAKAQIAKQHCEESDADTKNGDIHCHFECPVAIASWPNAYGALCFHSRDYAAAAHRVSREGKRLKNKKVIYVLTSGR